MKMKIKIKSGLILGALLAAVLSAPAAVVYWDAGGDGYTWTNAPNWGGDSVPVEGDHVIFLNNNSGTGLLNTNVGTVGILAPAWHAGSSGEMNVTVGGQITATSFMRLGYEVDAVGTLNMDGGLLVANILQNGFNSVVETAGGSGVVNLSGSSILHAGSFGFGQENPDYAPATDQDGIGEIHIAGNARFIVNGVHTNEDWIANGWIDAHGVPGRSIVATYDVDLARTDFTATGAPATNLFLDSFDIADTNNANVDVHSRQAANSLVTGVYAGFPTLSNITSNKLNVYWHAAFLDHTPDMASYLEGQEFEFSFKMASTKPAGWTAIYLTDETPSSRVNSRLGLHIYGNPGGGALCTIYSGTGPAADQTVDIPKAAVSATYDIADEHTFQFFSHPGPGGTNTYDLVIDGVTVASGVPYYFAGSKLKIGIVGINDVPAVNDPTQGAFIDDLYLAVIQGVTYEDWVVDDTGLTEGVNDARTDNPDLDSMDNLLEYALGGDPLVNDDATILPTAGLVNPGGTNYVNYVYRRRVDAATRGLAYDVNYTLDLVIAPMTNLINNVTGTASIDSQFESVTNPVPTGFFPEAFFRLDVTEN